MILRIMFPSRAIPESERAHCVRFLVGFGGLIVAWAVVHDLNLMRIDHRHFTEFHRPLLPLSSHFLLAIQYAVVATLGPGLLFGAVAFCLCRLGPWQTIRFRKAWFGFLPFLVAVEAASLFAGYLARKRFIEDGSFLFPEVFYPDVSPGILFTQSANIAAYLAAFIGSLLFFLILTLVRYFSRPREGI